VFEALRADFPAANVFESQQNAHGKVGSRTGTGFDLYRGDDAYAALLARSSAWREFDGYINSERFLDTFREAFRDYLPAAGLRVELASSHVDPAYFEPRELLTETATLGDKVNTIGHRLFDRFRAPGAVSLFTRLDIHRSVGGYAKPPHCDRANRLCSLIIYFTDADAAGLEGGELLIFKHKQAKPIGEYERHPKGGDVEQVAHLKTRPNLGVFFPCQNNSYHGVTEVKNQNAERDFLYINISGQANHLW
jgi:hypothetical protein